MIQLIRRHKEETKVLYEWYHGKTPEELNAELSDDCKVKQKSN